MDFSTYNTLAPFLAKHTTTINLIAYRIVKDSVYRTWSTMHFCLFHAMTRYPFPLHPFLLVALALRKATPFGGAYLPPQINFFFNIIKHYYKIYFKTPSMSQINFFFNIIKHYYKIYFKTPSMSRTACPANSPPSSPAPKSVCWKQQH